LNFPGKNKISKNPVDLGDKKEKNGARSVQNNTNSGFTMMELIVVVAIIAIMSAIAFGSLENLLPRVRTQSAARQLRAVLQKAKLEAVKRNTNCFVDITVAAGTDSGTCLTCIDLDGTTGCQTGGADVIISTLNLNDTGYNDAVLQSATFTGSTDFEFNPRGMPERVGVAAFASGNAVINCASDATYSITIFLASSGRIRIQ
jgi:prepilin-type N-terminal cleavage/methylation domain-containing protein